MRRRTYKEAVTKNHTANNTAIPTKAKSFRGSYPKKIDTISYSQYQENLRLAKETEEKEEINITKLTTLTLTDHNLKSAEPNNSQESLTSEKSDETKKLDSEYEEIDPKELIVEDGWTIC